MDNNIWGKKTIMTMYSKHFRYELPWNKNKIIPGEIPVNWRIKKHKDYTFSIF